MSNPLAAFVESTLKSDTAASGMKSKVEELAVKILDRTVDQWEFLDEGTQSRIQKDLLGPIIRGLGMDDEEAAFEKARVEFVEVLAQCIGVGGDDSDEDDPDIEFVEAMADDFDDYEVTDNGVQ